VSLGDGREYGQIRSGYQEGQEGKIEGRRGGGDRDRAHLDVPSWSHSCVSTMSLIHESFDQVES